MRKRSPSGTVAANDAPDEDLVRFAVRLILFLGPLTMIVQRGRVGELTAWILPCVVLGAGQGVLYTLIYPWLKQRPAPMPHLRFFLVNWASFGFALFLAITISRGGDAVWKIAFGTPAPGMESEARGSR